MRAYPFLLALFFSSTVLAAGGYVGPGKESRYTGPSVTKQANINTVATALNARDDTQVILQGHITRHLGRDRYEFTDNTGMIKVEIDDDLWPAEQISEKTTVKIYGEVDRSRRGVEIEVDHLEIVR